MKLADTQDLGSCIERCAGSSPAPRTSEKKRREQSPYARAAMRILQTLFAIPIAVLACMLRILPLPCNDGDCSLGAGCLRFILHSTGAKEDALRLASGLRPRVESRPPCHNVICGRIFSFCCGTFFAKAKNGGLLTYAGGCALASNPALRHFFAQNAV